MMSESFLAGETLLRSCGASEGQAGFCKWFSSYLLPNNKTQQMNLSGFIGRGDRMRSAMPRWEYLRRSDKEIKFSLSSLTRYPNLIRFS
jgi:hypothetical protein